MNFKSIQGYKHEYSVNCSKKTVWCVLNNRVNEEKKIYKCYNMQVQYIFLDKLTELNMYYAKIMVKNYVFHTYVYVCFSFSRFFIKVNNR